MKPIRILIMGLPGSGKTTLAGKLKEKLEDKHKSVDWFNADEIRKKFNDWDFSTEGRIRQSIRMFELSLTSNSDFVICDFIAPLVEMRENFKPDYIVWLDTIDKGRFDDTNKAFVPPVTCDFKVTEQNAEFWSDHIVNKILNSQSITILNIKEEDKNLIF